MPSALEAGSLLMGRYRLLEEVGQGGFGHVWRVHDESGIFRQPLALKILNPEGSKSALARRRFSSEAQLLLKLNHPNIVRAIDYLEDKQSLYLVMEYLPGRALSDILAARSQRNQVFSDIQVRTIFQQLSSGLRAAHAAGAVHRDLKPSNVMLVQDGPTVRLKILDFGVAKIMATNLGDRTTVGRMVGSYMYMSPEQAQGETVDHRSDVFALGVLLFEVLTLRRAWALNERGVHLPLYENFRFERQNTLVRLLERIVHGPRPRPTQCRAELPAAIDLVVRNALASRPEGRPNSVDELYQQLDEAFEQTLAIVKAIHSPTPEEADLTEIYQDNLLAIDRSTTLTVPVAQPIPRESPTEFERITPVFQTPFSDEELELKHTETRSYRGLLVMLLLGLLAIAGTWVALSASS